MIKIFAIMYINTWKILIKKSQIIKQKIKTQIFGRDLHANNIRQLNIFLNVTSRFKNKKRIKVIFKKEKKYV